MLESRAVGLLGQVPARLMDQANDAFHLGVLDLFGAVGGSVVVGVQAGVKENRRDPALKEGPVVAAAEQIGHVVVEILLERQAEGALDCSIVRVSEGL